MINQCDGASASGPGSSPVGTGAGQAVSALPGNDPSRFAHFGDPCIFCGVGLDDIAPGACPTNDGKLRVAGYVSLGVRWDGYETFRYRTTDGKVREVVQHVSYHAPYYHFGLSDYLINTPPRDPSLISARVSA